MNIEYPTQMASRSKGCPRGAFIGLCEAGLVNGVQRSGPGNLTKNGEYAIAAAEALKHNPALAYNKSDLWQHACVDQPKVQNGQMEVVVALANAGLLRSA